MAKKKIRPYPYQEECLQKIEEVRQNGVKRALVVMASGLGKTYTSAFAVERFFADRTFGRVLVLCHSEEILTQTKKKFKKYFGEEYNYGMFTNSRKTRVRTSFLFAMFQTMKGHRTEFAKDEFDYVVVDEAHHSYARTYFPTIKYFEPQFLLGLTATPDRLDGQKITEIYGEPIYELDFVEANCRDLLTKCDYRLVLDDMSQEKLDEYVQSNEKLTIGQLNRTIFVPKRDEEIVRLIRECMDGLEDPKTMIFCRTIKHARKIARLVGNEAALVYHGQGDVANEMALEAFREGRLRMIISVQMLNEGIDVPDANHVVFLRSTVSPAVFYQQLGRGTRLSPGKTTVIVQDFVANCERVQEIIRLQNEIDDFRTRPPKDDDDYGAGGGDEQKNFTLNIATPEFKTKMVDIAELLERAVKYSLYSDQRLLDDFKCKAEQLGGRAPTKEEIDNDSEMASSVTYTNRFGSLRKVAELVGVIYDRNSIYTDEQLLSLLKNKAQREHKTTLTQQDLRLDKTMPDTETYVNHFGSFLKALELAGLETNFIPPYTDRELLDAYILKGRRDCNGEAPTTQEVTDDPGMASVDTYIKHFKDWQNLRKLSGLKRRTNGDWGNATEQDIIDAIIEWSKDHDDRFPTCMEMRQDMKLPLSTKVIRVFGSLDNAAKKCGMSREGKRRLAVRPVRRNISNEDLIQSGRKIVYKNGRPLTQADLDSNESIAGSRVYRKRFGGIQQINLAIGTDEILAELAEVKEKQEATN